MHAELAPSVHIAGPRESGNVRLRQNRNLKKEGFSEPSNLCSRSDASPVKVDNCELDD